MVARKKTKRTVKRKSSSKARKPVKRKVAKKKTVRKRR